MCCSSTGEKITYKGEADETPDTIAGDVVVVLQVTEHPTFRRDGHNLFIKKTITLIEALTGFQFHVTHLDGRVLLVKPEAGMVVKPGMIKCIKDEGMPQAKNPYQRGHLFVEFDVQFPSRSQLDEMAIRALTAVLPRPVKEDVKKSIPPPSPTGEKGAGETGHLQDFYEVALIDVDMNEEKRKNAAMQEGEHDRESYEDDDEEGHSHGGQRAQAGCQQQ